MDDRNDERWAEVSPRAEPTDYGELMKRVEQLVEELETVKDVGSTIRTVAGEVVRRFRSEVGLTGGRIYRRRGEAFVLQTTFGEAKPVEPGIRIPLDYPAVDELLERRITYMERDDPRLDPELEARLGAGEFAAIEVAVGGQEYLLAFDVAPGHQRNDVLLSLGILRHNILDKLRRERLSGVIEEARLIQTSILPRKDPRFASFDICGRIASVEAVGGDFYDFIPITEKILGLAIADVSGHGLTAALQVRDIHMGLRMGLARDYKIVRTVERLNQIIHSSTLTSRFVSLFYGELEANGVFIYVNAGHPPPFHLSVDGRARALREGGAVLGPIPAAGYERGFVQLAPGDLLVLYTDGIVETLSQGGRGEEDEFGSEGLLGAIREVADRPSREIVDQVFARLTEFGGGAALDDRTLVVVRAGAGSRSDGSDAA